MAIYQLLIVASILCLTNVTGFITKTMKHNNNNNIISTNVSPLMFGTYIMRKTDNKLITSQYTFLIVNDSTNIKLKTIQENGFLATKVSKTGTIEYIPSAKNVYNFITKQTEYDVVVKINNVNKYSYSLFGIEFPEFRYKQISNYNIHYKMKAVYSDKTLYIVDKSTREYYLFDLYTNNKTNKLPYIEVSFNTFIITQVLSFLINLLLIQIHFS